jgi:hypothetical protein
VTADTPDFLLQRALRAPGGGAAVVAGSTPVVSYGDPGRATVVTLGVCPSGRQFLDHGGRLLAGGRRRLATLESLGVERHEHLTEDHAAAIVAGCVGYFDRHPYHWFDPLDDLLRRAVGASYRDGSACHLDLVQWATAGGWGALTVRAQADLLARDGGVVRRQLDRGDHRIVLVNGRATLRWVQESGLVTWRRSHVLDGVTATGVYTGRRGDLPFVGWCADVPRHPGAAALAPRLAELVAELVAGPVAVG